MFSYHRISGKRLTFVCSAFFYSIVCICRALVSICWCNWSTISETSVTKSNTKHTFRTSNAILCYFVGCPKHLLIYGRLVIQPFGRPSHEAHNNIEYRNQYSNSISPLYSLIMRNFLIFQSLLFGLWNENFCSILDFFINRFRYCLRHVAICFL